MIFQLIWGLSEKKKPLCTKAMSSEIFQMLATAGNPFCALPTLVSIRKAFQQYNIKAILKCIFITI